MLSHDCPPQLRWPHRQAASHTPGGRSDSTDVSARDLAAHDARTDIGGRVMPRRNRMPAPQRMRRGHHRLRRRCVRQPWQRACSCEP
eukprot:3315159-Rhodomonas_salina.1